MKRGGPPARRAPMERGPGPARQTPMPARTRPLPQGKPLAAVSARRQATPPPPRPRRETGFTAEVKLAVRTRAGGGDPLEARCEVDGVWLGIDGGQVHHRCNRQMGGSRRRNVIQNAALLCGTPQTGCHGAATRLEVRMRDRGFVLDSGQNPLLVPVRPYGDERPRWLTAEGGCTFTPPEGAEAA